jgi:hypothetical protein
MVKKTFQMGLMGAPGTDSMLKALGSDPATTIAEMGLSPSHPPPLPLRLSSSLSLSRLL